MKKYQHDEVSQVSQPRPMEVQTRTEQPSGNNFIPFLAPEMQQQVVMGSSVKHYSISGYFYNCSLGVSGLI